MTQDDVLFGYRLQLVDLAARTYYRWKAQVDRQGVERLRPRERRRADAQSDRADRRGADRGVLARPPGARAAADRGDARAGGVGRAVRLAQRRVEGAAPPRDLDARSPTVVDRRLPRALRGAARGGARGACDSDRPGELVGIDCFFVGRLSYTKGAVWPVTAIDTCSSYAWVGLVRAPTTGPQAEHTIPLAQRVARELAQAGGVLQRVLTDNGNEFRAERFNHAITALGARQTRIRAGRPQTNGHVERLHRTILEECWRPTFARFDFPGYTSLRRHLDSYITYYHHHRAHTGRTTARRTPAEVIYGARKMEPR